MIQGTTPTHKFNLPFNTDSIERVRIVYEQAGDVVLTKENEECTLSGNTVLVRMSQEDTLKFKSNVNTRIQVHLRTKSGEAYASNLMRVSVYELLHEEVI
jgi:hypothetical protein